MNIKIIPIIFLSINTLKMLKKDSPIVLQNINMIARQLFLLFKKSMIFWDNPRIWRLFVCLLFYFVSSANYMTYSNKNTSQ